MSAEVITKDDLQVFRIQLIDDIKRLLDVPQTQEQNEEWIKSKEARRILKASPGTLQNLRISGKLNPVKVSGTWRYSLSEVNALLQKGK